MINAPWLLSLLQGISLLAFAPFFRGWLKWWKAQLTGRRRPFKWTLQVYRDYFKLLRIPPKRLKTPSWFFRISPYLIFTTYGSLLFTIPLWTAPSLPIDLLLIMYLLGLGRFILSLAGLDSGTSFGHLGSSREMFFHLLSEISFFSAITAFWLWRNVTPNGELFWLAAAAILFSYFFILVLETHRLPVGNPGTHLELTMAGKAVELEFSGRDLALVEWGETSKLLFLVALWSQWIVQLGLIPFHGTPIMPGWLLFLFYISLWLLIAWGLACWEWRSVKMRLSQVPSFVLPSLALSLSAILLRLIQGAD